MSGLATLFTGVKTPAIQPQPAAPSREDPAVEDARRKAQIAVLSQRGRASTLLTLGGPGGPGVPGPANIATKRLLGAAPGGGG